MEKLLIICVLISGVLLDDSRICKIRTRILNDGDRFETQTRCFFCECRNQTLNCKQEPDACPQLPCETAVQLSAPRGPRRCCKTCPGVGSSCWFNGMTVEDGDTFRVDPSGSCKCYNGKITCS